MEDLNRYKKLATIAIKETRNWAIRGRSNWTPEYHKLLKGIVYREREEMEGICFLHIVQADQTFDEKRNGARNTHAIYRAKRALRKWVLKEAGWHRQHGSFPQEDAFPEESLENQMRQIVEELPEPERSVILARYWARLTQAELANNLQYSIRHIRRLENNAKELILKEW